MDRNAAALPKRSSLTESVHAPDPAWNRFQCDFIGHFYNRALGFKHYVFCKMDTLLIAAQTPKLKEALSAQVQGDWQIVSEDNSAMRTGLGVFKSSLTRYAMISAADTVISNSLNLRGMLLYWLSRLEIDQVGAMALESTSGGIAGMIFNRELLQFHSRVPRRRGQFFEDVIDHLQSVGIRFESVAITDEAIKAYEAVQPGGWYEGCDDEQNAFPEPTIAPSLFSCMSNDLYGGSSILRSYCGVKEYLPIVGRIQHGWEPGPGNVIEAANVSKIDRYYTWSPLATRRLGMIRVHSELESAKILLGKPAFDALGDGRPTFIAIGAPYLYLPEVLDVGPVNTDWLLAVPGHGTLCSPDIAHPWSKFLACTKEFATERGFKHVSISLYADDDKRDNREIVRSFGFVPVSSGRVGNPGYLGHVRSFIRQHAAVISDRVCTAGMYALYENRPFWIVGAGTVSHDPPDAYADLVTDEEWIREFYPGIWRGGLAGREEALRELGTKLPPERLKRMLWYWIWDGVSQ